MYTFRFAPTNLVSHLNIPLQSSLVLRGQRMLLATLRHSAQESSNSQGYRSWVAHSATRRLNVPSPHKKTPFSSHYIYSCLPLFSISALGVVVARVSPTAHAFSSRLSRRIHQDEVVGSTPTGRWFFVLVWIELGTVSFLSCTRLVNHECVWTLKRIKRKVQRMDYGDVNRE